VTSLKSTPEIEIAMLNLFQHLDRIETY